MAVESASAQFYSSETEPLQPRIEAGAKVGTERSIGSMEGWMPLAQDNGSVLYADIRWTADDGDNREGNLGLGYRKIVSDTLAGDAIVGGHGWIDRRHTDRGSTFHQITAGAEYLKEDWDVKANAYIPLNKDKEYFTPNIGSSTPYLAGTGIFVDTAGYIVEEAQPGGDVEVGYRLPVLESKLDAVRVYGGGYAFIGDQTDDVIGGRVRASVDVNPLVNVGARFQYDEPRGSQGFLEATLRFPFGAKKRFQTNKLRARLDESPERDIDIVTGSKVDNGLRKEVVNAASGQTQRVIHVDNTAANGGNGSIENPFNTLAAAQAAMLDNDVIYVHRGDGTTTGMNQGILINKSNVQLIGSGTDFVFDTGKFTTRRSGQPIDGTVIVAGGAAPVITNTIPDDPAEDLIGSGVAIIADRVSVGGIAIYNATSSGIVAQAQGNQVFNSVTIHDVNITGGIVGILALSDGSGAALNSVKIHDSTVSGTIVGVRVQARNGGKIDNALVENNIASGNTRGIEVRGDGAGSILSRAEVRGNTTNNNGQQGLGVNANAGSMLGKLIFDNNMVLNNGYMGIIVQNSSHIDDLTISNSQFLNTTQNGVMIDTANNSYFGNILIQDNNTSNNTLNGIYVNHKTAAQINALYIEGNNVANNGRNGVFIEAVNTASINASLSENTVTGNAPNPFVGININNDSTGTFNVDMGGGSMNSIGRNRIYGNTYRDLSIDSRPGTVGTTPGTTISAQYNWWGINTGLNQGTRALFDNGSASPGSSIDASNFLTTDPGI